MSEAKARLLFWPRGEEERHPLGMVMRAAGILGGSQRAGGKAQSKREYRGGKAGNIRNATDGRTRLEGTRGAAEKLRTVAQRGLN